MKKRSRSASEVSRHRNGRAAGVAMLPKPSRGVRPESAADVAADTAGKPAGGAATHSVGSRRPHDDPLHEQARSAYQRGRAASAGLAHRAREHVRQKPIQSLLIAVGLGFLASLLWRRR